MGTRDQRSRSRQETRQSATAKALGQDWPCEIRNVCRLGLYLSFAASPPPVGRSFPWPAQSLVEVLYTGTSAGQARLFSITGVVAHATTAGAGLYVPSMPEEALQALQAAGSAGPVDDDAEAVAASSLSQHPGIRRFEQGMEAVLKDWFDGLGDGFDAAIRGLTDPDEKKRLRQAPLVLNTRRALIRERFFASIVQHLQALQASQPRATPPAQAAEELALLDEDEFEDWLRLAAVVQRVESEADFKLALAAVERRVGRLVGSPLDKDTSPFGPTLLCRALQAAMQALDLEEGVRAVAYQTFGDALLRGLGRVYDAMLAALPDRPASEAATATPPSNPTPAPTAAQASTPLPSPASPSLEPGPPVPPGPPAVPAAAPQPVADLAAEPTPDPRPLGLTRLATELLRTAARPAPPTAPAPSSAAGPLATVDELLRAIDHQPSSQWKQLADPQGGALSERMARAVPGHHLSTPVRQSLDSTGSLLGYAMAVSGGGPTIDQLLNRLAAPLLKLSVRNGGFPEGAEDPAQQVVNLLEQYAIATDDEGRFLDAKVERYLHLWVDRICSQADADPAVWKSVRDRLERLLAPIRQNRRLRIGRLQEACEGRQRIRRARERVRAALDARLQEQAVPEIVLRLLEAGWRQHLVLLELRVGCENPSWAQALEPLEALLRLLAPSSADPQPERDWPAAVTLCSLIEQQLTRVNPDAGRRDAFMADLLRALDEAVRGGRPPPQGAYLPRERGAEARRGPPEALPPQGSVFERLSVGDWWHVRTADRWLPMQLIWVAEPATDCAFANRSATERLELTMAELSRRVREGSIKLWSDQEQPLLDRSVHAMLDDGRHRMQQRAHQDPVTGLLNRKGFLLRLDQLARSARADGTHLLAIIEFDQFRVVYQALGLSEGEALARSLAQAVQACLASAAVLASFRDDTLALLLPARTREAGLEALQGVLDRIADHRYQPAGKSFRIGANIGVAVFDPSAQAADVTVQQADMACVAAKALGRNRLQCYGPDSRPLRSQQALVDWAGRIDELISGSGLYLRVQRILPLRDDPALLPHHEVLLGIDLGPGGPVGPLPFILAVEALRRAHEIDLWVLQRTFAWIRANRPVFMALGGLSINLSAMSLADPEVMACLRGVQLAGDIPPGRIIFEITETAAVESYAVAGDFIRQMRRHGWRFALDDFGSGHASYAHLKNLRVETLKIDGSFVKDIVHSPSDYAIVKSMNDIAHSLGLHTVAEFVETPQILDKLREIGVDYAQGYAIHKPCPIDQIERQFPLGVAA